MLYFWRSQEACPLLWERYRSSSHANGIPGRLPGNGQCKRWCNTHALLWQVVPPQRQNEDRKGKGNGRKTTPGLLITTRVFSRNLCRGYGSRWNCYFLQPHLSVEVCQIFEANIRRAHPRKGEKRWFTEQILWYRRLWSNLPSPWRMKFLLCPENQHSDEPITSLSPGWFLPALPLQCRLILKKMAWHYTQSGF